MQAYTEIIFITNKCIKIVVRLARTTATLADGLGTGRGSVGVPLGGWILFGACWCGSGDPWGFLALAPEAPPTAPPTALPALASLPTDDGPTPRSFRSVSSLLRPPPGPSCLLLVSASLRPRSGSWRSASSSGSRHARETRRPRGSRAPASRAACAASRSASSADSGHSPAAADEAG